MEKPSWYPRIPGAVRAAIETAMERGMVWRETAGPYWDPVGGGDWARVQLSRDYQDPSGYYEFGGLTWTGNLEGPA